MVEKRQRTPRPPWDGAQVKALRRHLQKTQTELADEMGIRQQTISEWETEVYRPRGASRTLLTLIAERTRFPYGVEDSPRPEEGSEEAS